MDVKVMEKGLAGIETTIGESMKELIDSQQESRYKEMLLLVDDYTQNILSSTPETFKKVIRKWQKMLRKNAQRWDELDSNEKGLSIDFNYELFIREARLWKDHAFSSTSLDYHEVQRQMIMFVTMYTLIDKRKDNINTYTAPLNIIKLKVFDKGMFSHLEKKKAKHEWRRVEASKAAFLADTLASFKKNC